MKQAKIKNSVGTQILLTYLTAHRGLVARVLFTMLEHLDIQGNRLAYNDWLVKAHDQLSDEELLVLTKMVLMAGVIVTEADHE